MKIVIAFALSALIYCEVTAQKYAFKVLVNKGQNQVKSGNEWLPIKVGASLQPQDELKVSQNAYLGLVHSSGKPLEVKKAGNHKVSDLAAGMKGGSSVLNKYTDFILSSTDQKAGNLTATGAVHRGPDDIKVFLPKPQFAIVYNDDIAISWARNSKVKDYIVSFNSMFGDELQEIEVKDTTVSIALDDAKFGHLERFALNQYGNRIGVVGGTDIAAAGDRRRVGEIRRHVLRHRHGYCDGRV